MGIDLGAVARTQIFAVEIIGEPVGECVLSSHDV